MASLLLLGIGQEFQLFAYEGGPPVRRPQAADLSGIK